MNAVLHDASVASQELADAAEFLLPIAWIHVRSGLWPPEVAAWLVMVRDSLGHRPEQGVH